jgi:predicted RND superfamily exporter protein
VSELYLKCLKYPFILLGFSLFAVLVMVSRIHEFSFDASSDTLVVQGDPKLAQYTEMSSMFGGDDFIVLTYSSDDVLSPIALEEINVLQEKIGALEGIASTYSILDAPLIESPPIPLELLSENYNTLRGDTADLELARIELTGSPLISNYLIAVDGKTTAISATLSRDEALESLMAEREGLRTGGNADRLSEVESDYRTQREIYVAKRENLIEGLRQIKNAYPGEARLFISGVPMIAADMLTYVRSDLITFSGLVLTLIILLMIFFFRKTRWVAIPLTCCLATVTSTMGLLGWLGTPVTVVSSNFVSLLSIISISFSIHLVVRYRELLHNGDTDHAAMVAETMRSKWVPCLYTALTTLLAFGSMLGSRIVPIIDFGWMMCLGIVVSLVITYTLFPALVLLAGQMTRSRTLGQVIFVTELFLYLTTRKTRWVLGVSVLILLPTFYGLSLISFDNRFIDYFSKDTDIHQGMVQIDRNLGGTLPLDVYIRFERFEPAEDDFFGGFEDTFPERYWYTPNKLVVLNDLQRHLEARPEIGKVISLASMEQMARRFNDQEALSGLEISYVLGELPAEVRRFLIEPYAEPEAGWMRINARVRESVSDFSKEALITDIRSYAIDDLGLEPEDVVVTGMIVLFNDMLKQLAESQARTFIYVITATFIMFSLLLRSLRLAVIALIPNIIASLLVVSIMGLAGIALDMMTVTIAAICIGIGVDDAIHYLHRFSHELDKGSTVHNAVVGSHHTIGRAMYFTTMTIMGGFSILAFSNFIPTIYFGLLTAVAMVLALIANMTLLPALLLTFYKPADKII